ncbi:hypothetical protein TWF696_008611 [Orbilia brochopaga]|uniref:Uncharacterized protein n=1 Tax=Orbilia brochopaga TaxID=3140254 RepID=A0AAV9UJM1_9PEZI
MNPNFVFPMRPRAPEASENTAPNAAAQPPNPLVEERKTGIPGLATSPRPVRPQKPSPGEPIGPASSENSPADGSSRPVSHNPSAGRPPPGRGHRRTASLTVCPTQEELRRYGINKPDKWPPRATPGRTRYLYGPTPDHVEFNKTKKYTIEFTHDIWDAESLKKKAEDWYKEWFGEVVEMSAKEYRELWVEIKQEERELEKYWVQKANKDALRQRRKEEASEPDSEDDGPDVDIHFVHPTAIWPQGIKSDRPLPYFP